MTTMEIMMACAGLLICAGIFTAVCLLIICVIWWVFRTNMDIEIDINEWEEEK